MVLELEKRKKFLILDNSSSLLYLLFMMQQSGNPHHFIVISFFFPFHLVQKYIYCTSNQFDSSGYNLGHLVQQAQTRWLKPPEVLFILHNYEDHQLTDKPPQNPPSINLPLPTSNLLLLSYYTCMFNPMLAHIFHQVVPSFFLIRGSFAFSVKMVITGVGRRTGELLAKRMNALRYIHYFYHLLFWEIQLS